MSGPSSPVGVPTVVDPAALPGAVKSEMRALETRLLEEREEERRPFLQREEELKQRLLQ